MSILKDFNSARIRSGAPVTTTIVILMVVGFVACWLDKSFSTAQNLMFSTSSLGVRPWTIMTYPLCELNPVSLFFAAVWFWGVGAVVEREEGPHRFAGFFVAMSALCALGLWIGSRITGNPGWIASAWTPIAAVTIVWGTRHPTVLVQLMLVLPIQARWVAWFSAALVFFETRPPEMAPFAAVPLVLAWLFAAKRLPSLDMGGGGKASDKSRFVRGAGFYSKEYFDDVKRREKEREEKERLKKLFEGGTDNDAN